MLRWFSSALRSSHKCPTGPLCVAFNSRGCARGIEPLEDRRLLAVVTSLLEDINSQPTTFVSTNLSSQSDFVEMNGHYYFSAGHGATGAELWKTDGTEAGTLLVKDIVSVR